MDPEKLKEITRIASEAVKDLDSDLKADAFKTILDKLLAQAFEGTKVKSKVRKARKSKVSSRVMGVHKVKPEADKVINDLMSKLDSTKHPVIYRFEKTLDRALYLLKAAKDDASIDGLFPKQISTVLLDKFRLKATPNAVSMALMKAGAYVDRQITQVGDGTAYGYRIMHPGEAYLATTIENLKKGNTDENKNTLTVEKQD